jgi:membrane protease YdiL (CAAX protease family)
MTDQENIPQSDPQAVAPNEVVATSSDPATLAAHDSSGTPALNAHQYPPSFFASELPPSPEQLAEQLRISQIPPDLRVPWGWTDLGIFLLFYLGGTVLLLIIAMIAAVGILHIPFPSLQKHPMLLIVVTIIAQTASSIAALLYFWILVRVRRAGKLWPTLGWHSLDGTHTDGATVLKYLFSGVALAITVTVMGQFVKQSGPVPFEEFFKARQSVLMLMAFGILIAPLVEETIFRGFLYPVAARQFGIVGAIIFTGIIFGAFHAMQLWGAWGQIALLVIVGIVLTAIRARTGSVLASFLVHVAYNSTLFAGLLIGSHGLRDFPVGK